MNFYLGCAVWSYQGWIGNFYPPKSKSADLLQLYSQRLTTVECNATFYAIPDRKLLRRWREQTTADFRFCLKLPRDITHQGRLQKQIPSALEFMEKMQVLGENLGGIFAQLPPSYGPDYLDDLEIFLAAIAKQPVPLALEVRHPAWFAPPVVTQLNRMLSQFQIARVLLDTRPIYSSPDDPQANHPRRKPQLPLQPTLTANWSLVRFISHPQAKYNQSFLQEWVALVTEWLHQGRKVYFLVHCPVEERSPDNAFTFQEMLQAHQAPIPTLPWQQLNLPQQLSLFEL